MRRYHTLRLAGIGAVLAVLAVAPFYQGLFFPVPMLIAITSLVFGYAAWAYGRRKDGLPIGFPAGWTGALLLALTLAYLLQFGWAAYGRGNLDWFLRMVAGWVAFAILAQESAPPVRRWFTWAVLASTAVVAFMGILEYGQFFEQYLWLKELLSIKNSSGRLTSVLQYPNAAGAVLLVSWIVVQGLLLEKSSPAPKQQAILGGLGALFGLAAFLTLSRGVVLIIPIAAVLFWLGLARHQVSRSVLYMVGTMVVPLAVGSPLLLATVRSAGWGLVLLLAVAACAAGALATEGARRLSALPGRTLPLLATACVAVALIAGAVWLGTGTESQGAVTASSRLLDINLETQNAVSRLEFLKDAVRIFLDQPMGHGGFGWERMYRQYQQVSYISRETHNHYAQVLVEAGLLGILALGGALVSALWTGFRTRREQPVRWAMVTGGTILAIHAAMDFDLSYLYVWLLLWALMAMGQEPAALPNRKEPKLFYPVTAGLALLLGAYALTLTVAAVTFRQAEYAVLRKEYDRALKLAKTAVSLDPTNSQHLKLVRTEENLRRATQVDPANSLNWNELALFYESRDLKQALSAAKQAVSLSPVQKERYTVYTRIASKLMDSHAVANDRQQATELATEVSAVLKSMEEARLLSIERLPQTAAIMAWTPQNVLAAGKAHFLLGNLQAAEESFLSAAKEPSLTEEASLWLYAIYAKQRIDRPVPKPLSLEALRLPLLDALMKW